MSRSPAPPPHHIDYLDGWRGMAILFLLAGHFFPIKGMDLGVLGVNLFFVLSGYLMSGLLFIQATPIDTFYKRRISRIIPAHLVFLTLVGLLSIAFNRPSIASEWLSALLLINNYASDLGHIQMPVGHIWSLSVEEHSYIALSLVAIMCRRKAIQPAILVAMLCAVCVIFGVWYAYSPNSANWNHTEVAGFAIFASALFRVYLSRFSQLTNVDPVFPALFLIGVGLHWWSIPKVVQAFVGVGALALLVNLMQWAPQLLQRALSIPLLRKFGIWSFSIYLWQQPFYFLVQHEGLISPTIGCTLGICCGVLSYYAIESPARKFINRTWAN